MKKYIIANWKMQPVTTREAEDVFDGIQKSAPKLKNTEIVVCPPFVYLDALSKKLKSYPPEARLAKGGKLKVKLGAQDFFWENPPKGGSYTGEISVSMLKDFGIRYAIVGHSEERDYLNVTDEMINKKIKTALKAGIKIIFCAGEKERDEDGAYLKFIKKEIHEGLSKISKKDMENLIIAYEPIWAISSSKDAKADTPENLFEMSIYIRRVLFFKFGRKVSKETSILYGGSVDAKNARDFLEKGNVQGLLVGRASWKEKSFIDLLKSIKI